ncbi:hypothetical protein HKX48_009379 [Thoreauomyces humboldtii]|nr:hypothetical protein HKX48_009379 [Thoreauomyces humboldtii]
MLLSSPILALLVLLSGHLVLALQNITLGFLFAFEGVHHLDQVQYAALYSLSAAVHYANAQQIIPGAYINLLTLDTQSSPSTAIKVAYEAANAGVFAVVGPGDSATGVYSSLVTGSFNLPTCVIGAGTIKFLDRASYPNVFRLVRSVDSTVVAMLRWIIAMGWSEIGFLYSGQELGASYVDPISRYAKELAVQVKAQVSFNIDGAFAGEDSAIDVLQASNARIVVLAGDVEECTRIWLKAYRAGLVTSDFVWVTTNGITAFGDDDSQDGNLNATPDSPSPNVNATLGADIAGNTGVLEAWIPNASQTTPIYQTYLDNYNDIYNQSVGDYWDYEEQDWIWDCGMALFYGFGQLLAENNLPVSALVNPDYSQPAFANVTNLSIFNTMRVGMYGLYDFVDGDLVYQAQEIGNIDNQYAVASFDPYTNVTISDDGFIVGTPVQPLYWTLSMYMNQLTFFGGRASTDVPADHPLPEYLNPTWRSGQGMAFAAAAAILLTTKLAVLVGVIWFRTSSAFKRASWKSLALILMGLMLADASVFLYIGNLSHATCMAQPFFLNVAFGLVFSNLLAKTWRVFKIFDNPYKMSKPIQDLDLTLFSLTVVAIEILIGTVWVATSRPVATDVAVNDLQAIQTCISPNSQTQSVMMAISLVFNGVLLVLTTILSYKTRNVASMYNETKWIALSAYNIFAICALFIPLIFKDTFASYVFIFRSLLILLSAGTTEVLLFLPKIMEFLRPDDATTVMVKRMIERNADSMNPRGSSPFHESIESGSDPYGSSAQVGCLMITGAPVLLLSSGGALLNWATSRWQKCNVTVAPGHIVVEIPPPSEHGKRTFKVFSTEAAVSHLSDAFRSKDMTVLSRAGASLGAQDTVGPALPSSPGASPTVDTALLASPAYGNESEKPPPTLTTLRLITSDGTMEMLLTTEVAKDLNHMFPGG